MLKEIIKVSLVLSVFGVLSYRYGKKKLATVYEEPSNSEQKKSNVMDNYEIFREGIGA